MPDTSPISKEDQLRRFGYGIGLLGGTRSASNYMEMTERQIRFLMAGHRTLHDGHLRDLAAALIDRAEECRKLERLISPAFSENLTEEQAAKQGKPDGRRFDAKSQAEDPANG